MFSHKNKLASYKKSPPEIKLHIFSFLNAKKDLAMATITDMAAHRLSKTAWRDKVKQDFFIDVPQGIDSMQYYRECDALLSHLKNNPIVTCSYSHNDEYKTIVISNDDSTAFCRDINSLLSQHIDFIKKIVSSCMRGELDDQVLVTLANKKLTENKSDNNFNSGVTLESLIQKYNISIADSPLIEIAPTSVCESKTIQMNTLISILVNDYINKISLTLCRLNVPLLLEEFLNKNIMNADKPLLMMEAILHGQVNAVRVLIQHGTNMNEFIKFEYQYHMAKRNLLAWAIHHLKEYPSHLQASIEIIDLLIMNGSDPDQLVYETENRADAQFNQADCHRLSNRNLAKALYDAMDNLVEDVNQHQVSDEEKNSIKGVLKRIMDMPAYEPISSYKP